MYSNISNIRINIRQIFVEYSDGNIYEFVSDTDLIFPKGKDCSFSGTLNGIVGSCEIRDKNLILSSTNSAASFFFPSEVAYHINKFIKRGKIFDLNYCKHLRNTYSRSQFVETCLKSGNLEIWCESIEKLREKTRQYSTGIYKRPTLVYSNHYPELEWSIIKEGKVVEQGVFILPTFDRYK